MKLQTEKQKAKMWRNAAIRKEFKNLNDGKNAVTAVHKYLAEKYNLTATMIRLIIAEKEAK
jgi:phage shock protein PspC (stress-responsive transcriptional regulator)